MADVIDITAEREELEEEMRRRNHEATMRALEAQRPKPNGKCHWCGTGVAGEKIYCDGDCAAEHAHEQKLRRRLGR